MVYFLYDILKTQTCFGILACLGNSLTLISIFFVVSERLKHALAFFIFAMASPSKNIMPKNSLSLTTKKIDIRVNKLARQTNHAKELALKSHIKIKPQKLITALGGATL